MEILALDLSTKSTGWCVFQNNKLIDYGCLTASSFNNIERIKVITKKIKKILEQYPNIKKVIIEEVRPENNQYGVGNLHTHKVLMWLQASLIFMLDENFSSTKVEYVYPNEWRAACGIHTGRGIKRKELKAADIAFVKRKYNIEVNDDIADAIGIGYAYIYNFDNEINWG